MPAAGSSSTIVGALHCSGCNGPVGADILLRRSRRSSAASSRTFVALVIARGFEIIGAQAGTLRDTMNHLATAIVIVDRDARVTEVNAAGRRLFAAGDALIDGPNSLRAGSVAATTELHRAIVAAVSGALSGDGIVVLPRAGGGTPLIARVVPLGRTASERLQLGMPAAAILVDDPGSRSRPLPALLRRLFGLTAAECRLVLLLAEGHALADAAHSLELSRETLRTQLRRVFDKTGVRRQGDLLALVARLAP